MIRARLTDRHGTFIGYCDVPEQTTLGLPVLPEVITLTESTDRSFVRDPLRDAKMPRSAVPVYREATFAWAQNCRLTTNLTKGGA